MRRSASHLLILLVSVMALIPQALCPCAVRARAQAAEVPTGSAPAKAVRPCCSRCVRPTSAVAALHGQRPEPAAPVPCPCCAVNGQGKTLLTVGDAVRVEPLAVSGFEWTVPSAPVLACTVALASARMAGPTARPPPMPQRLLSVVLIV